MVEEAGHLGTGDLKMIDYNNYINLDDVKTVGYNNDTELDELDRESEQIVPKYISTKKTAKKYN